ncbi:MAG: hypothetical protein HW391_1093, partial [Chloroflexi bacterium]|nr:hypothetical protein [Chloroflexota bacterium]
MSLDEGEADPGQLLQQETAPDAMSPPTPTWSPYAGAGSKPPPAPTAERSQWDRIALT